MNGGARSTAAQYRPFYRRQASRWRGGSDRSSVFIFLPASSSRLLLSPFKIYAMVRPNLRIRAWSFAGSWRTKTIPSTILHVASKINAFFLATRAWGFGTALHRAAKILFSLVGAVGGWRGSCLCPPRCLACPLRGGLCGGIPEPCIGLSCAWGPGRKHSRRDGDPSP